MKIMGLADGDWRVGGDVVLSWCRVAGRRESKPALSTHIKQLYTRLERR